MRCLPILLLTVAALTFAGPVRADVTLHVVGADSDLQDSLTAASRLMAIEDPAALPGQDVIASARSDYARLLAALYERGYFGPEISIRLDRREAADISPFRAPAPIQDIAITITPGAAFRLGRAEIGPLAPGTTLPDGFATGATAGTRVLRQAAEAGITGWRAEGHATAAIASQQITARHAQAELDAQITLAPGPVASFGPLIPHGQDRMRPEAIARIAGLPTGARFDPDTLDRVAGRLRDTGAFTSVALTEGELAPDDSLPIRADLVEAPLRRLGFGAELSSTDGATLSAYWLHRNLFGGAERLRLDAEISGLGGENGGFDGLASAVYSIPAVLTPDTRLSFGVTLEHLDEVTFTLDRINLEAGLEHRFSDHLSGSLFANLGYGEITDAFSTRDVTMLSLPVGLTWDNRDNAFDARQGWYVDTTLTPFAMAEGSGGVRFTADARGYMAFGEDGGTRLAARLQLGTLDGGAIDTLPPDWLFFSGGADTVRGQGYQSLGAMQGGVLTGGRSFFGTSLELRQDLFGNFGAVLFADTGYVASDPYWDSGGSWHTGAGIGVRYDTPVGPIRLDLATPVGGAGAGEDLYFYIGIGQAF
jgi:translocation and assembly module TamA